MAETIGIGESVTVEVRRAGSSSPIQIPQIPNVAASEVNFGIIILIVGIIIAAVFAFLILRKHKGGGIPKWSSMKRGGFGYSRRRRFARALGMSLLFGFIGLFLSGSSATWILAAVIFYYEFFVRNRD